MALRFKALSGGGEAWRLLCILAESQPCPTLLDNSPTIGAQETRRVLFRHPQGAFSADLTAARVLVLGFIGSRRRLIRCGDGEMKDAMDLNENSGSGVLQRDIVESPNELSAIPPRSEISD